ncbi:MAG: hypothetical protein K2L17_08570 [Muribaculaceae bacterium]|nr:hypothetical protein [Muribaculaceae bacterium]
MITNLLSHNPYRILGVYSNSPKKDVLSNLNKMKAFLKVSKTVSFPLDLPQLLPSIERDEAIVSSAQTSIELPMDQIRHTLFWFMKTTQLDDIALNHLLSGNMAQAKEIWNKKETVSSLLNLMACAVIEGDLHTLAIKADILFQKYSRDFCLAVNETIKITPTELTELYIDLLKKDGSYDIAKMMQISGTSNEWRKTIGGVLVKPIIDEITLAIAEAKSAKGASANYHAGEKLMNTTKRLLSKLRRLLGIADMQYKMIADKLATTILQCGINYFNDIEEDDAVEKAMKLQNYALSIAEGQMAKDRCKENVDILRKIEPEFAIRKEMASIGKSLERFNRIASNDPLSVLSHTYGLSSPFSQQTSRYSESDIIDLLNDTKPELQKIKNKLGSSNETYLKISSVIASAAINALVDIVNKAQKSGEFVHVVLIRPLIDSAVNTMSMIGSLDMTPQCRTYYNNNKNTLDSINRQLQPRPAPSSGGCYIATMAYGDYDHPQVMVLRQFRDSYLSNRGWGRKFINFYYANSPHWVEVLKSHKHINALIRKVLDSFVYLWKKTSHYE